MKKIFFLIFLIIFLQNYSDTLTAQNLVPNPGFETYATCPINSYTAIGLATPWNSASSSSSTDYFNTCSTNYTVSASTGNGCAGLFFVCFGEFREYLQVQLISPLMQNNNYYVQFYAKRGSVMACNNIAANLSVTRPFATLGALQSLTPHIFKVGNPIIYDSLNWVKISGNYLALGGEEYLTIGNFFNDSHTQMTTFDLSSPYYYFDDIKVENSIGTNIKENYGNCLFLDLYPNPTSNLISISSPYEMKQIEVSNVAGQLLLSEIIDTKTHQLQLQHFAEGIYFVKVLYANGISVTKKVVVNR